LFFTNTVTLNPGSPPTASELTSGINTDDRFVLILRVPAGYIASGQSVRIGGSGVGQSSGYTLDSQASEVTLTVEGAKVYGIIASGSSGIPVDVLAYSA